MLCPGQVYESTLTIKGQTGAPSTVVLAITKPDGTAVTPAPTLGAGAQVGADWVVTYDYTLPTVGRFVFTWTTTGPGTAPYADVANVREAGVSVVGLGEVKTHLNITGTGSDDELTAFMQAATELIESKVGVCAARTFTSRTEEGRPAIVLPQRPVISVTSVTSAWSNGPTWATAQLMVDGEAGVVRPQFGAPLFWYGPWDVVYVAGRAQIPERWIHAAKEQIRHLWETQRGAAAPSVLQGEEIFTASAGYTFSVPRRVLELLEQDMVPSS